MARDALALPRNRRAPGNGRGLSRIDGAERAEQGLHSMADRFEGLVSRVTRAEAALRASQAA